MKSLRYVTPVGPEAECEPGSGGRVLQNLKRIRSKRDMDQVEIAKLEAAQERYLAIIGPETVFTAELICRMHRDWLGEVYIWAGSYRSVDISKGGFTWPPAFRIGQNMKSLETELLLRKTPCRPGLIDRVAYDMAEVHADLLLVHPFREGNGRLARWVADLMALQAGFSMPAYQFIGKGSMAEKGRYLEAVKLGYVRDYRALADFFVSAIERGRVEP